MANVAERIPSAEHTRSSFITMYDPVANCPKKGISWPGHILHRLMNLIKQLWQKTYGAEKIEANFTHFSAENLRCFSEKQWKCLEHLSLVGKDKKISEVGEHLIAIIHACFQKGVSRSDGETIIKIWRELSVTQRQQINAALKPDLSQMFDQALTNYDAQAKGSNKKKTESAIFSTVVMAIQDQELCAHIFTKLGQTKCQALCVPFTSEQLQVFFKGALGLPIVPGATYADFRHAVIIKVVEHLQKTPKDSKLFARLINDQSNLTFSEFKGLMGRFSSTDLFSMLKRIKALPICHRIMAYIADQLHNFGNVKLFDAVSELCKKLTREEFCSLYSKSRSAVLMSVKDVGQNKSEIRRQDDFNEQDRSCSSEERNDLKDILLAIAKEQYLANKCTAEQLGSDLSTDILQVCSAVSLHHANIELTLERLLQIPENVATEYMQQSSEVQLVNWVKEIFAESRGWNNIDAKLLTIAEKVLHTIVDKVAQKQFGDTNIELVRKAFLIKASSGQAHWEEIQKFKQENNVRFLELHSMIETIDNPSFGIS